jgi:hypothetical protein
MVGRRHDGSQGAKRMESLFEQQHRHTSWRRFTAQGKRVQIGS